MKVKKYTNEEFASPERRVAHDRKHRKDSSNEFPTNMFKSSYDYERAADTLAAIPVKTSDINSNDTVVGFIEERDGEEFFVKYDKSKILALKREGNNHQVSHAIAITAH